MKKRIREMRTESKVHTLTTGHISSEKLKKNIGVGYLTEEKNRTVEVFPYFF